MKIPLLCTGNSCRSQMAEGWARHLEGDQLEAWSAGIEKHGMIPHAVAVMRETTTDLTGKWFAVLVEVPVMPSVCRACNDSRRWFNSALPSA